MFRNLKDFEKGIAALPVSSSVESFSTALSLSDAIRAALAKLALSYANARNLVQLLSTDSEGNIIDETTDEREVIADSVGPAMWANLTTTLRRLFSLYQQEEIFATANVETFTQAELERTQFHTPLCGTSLVQGETISFPGRGRYSGPSLSVQGPNLADLAYNGVKRSYTVLPVSIAANRAYENENNISLPMLLLLDSEYTYLIDYIKETIYYGTASLGDTTTFILQNSRTIWNSVAEVEEFRAHYLEMMDSILSNGTMIKVVVKPVDKAVAQVPLKLGDLVPDGLQSAALAYKLLDEWGYTPSLSSDQLELISPYL